MSGKTAKQKRRGRKRKPSPNIDLEAFVRSRMPVKVRTSSGAPEIPLVIDLHCGAPVKHRDKSKEMCKCAVKLDSVGSTHTGVHVCLHLHKS